MFLETDFSISSPSGLKKATHSVGLSTVFPFSALVGHRGNLDFALTPTGINEKFEMEGRHCPACTLRRHSYSEVELGSRGMSGSAEDLVEIDFPEAKGPFSETKQLPG